MEENKFEDDHNFIDEYLEDIKMDIDEKDEGGFVLRRGT